MSKTLTEQNREWYFQAIESFDGAAVTLDRSASTLTYNAEIRSDESHVKSADPEELAHAVTIALLHSSTYGYRLDCIGHEIHYAHGSKGSKSDEIDIQINDLDQLPYALMELKAASAFSREKEDAIKNQLFGIAPLVGSPPRILVYATVEPKGEMPALKVICIDYTKYKTYEAWQDAGEPHSTVFPGDYQDLDYQPLVNQGENDLSLNGSQSDFRAVATGFHNEFFGEHPDNQLFVNLVKCLLAKIHDERTRKKGEQYEFQVLYKLGKPERAVDVYKRVNALYRAAFKRYIDPTATDIDDISPKEFSEERVKSVVLALQALSITKGAARHGDIIGAFFEEILRSGFKQDRGMYFTHDNIVRFMVEAIDLSGLTASVWKSSDHPDNRLPYVIDPACGSGTFLLHAMGLITKTIKNNPGKFADDHDSEQFYNARLSDAQPNYWAENFVYGFDPKFIMAITAKVNMVLHGDGSAHIYKEDAFKPFSSYSDVRLRPCSEDQRSISRAAYPPDICETFDVLVSNPPFGITLSGGVKAKLGKTFTLSKSTPSEGLFIERAFQLLKPGGRLGVVIPESILNAKELADVRLFIYRFFNIKACVSLPRNIFIDTPTLCSLLFAEKKTSEEITKWDDAWKSVNATVEKQIKKANRALTGKFVAKHTASEVEHEVVQALDGIIADSAWVVKGGRDPSVINLKRPPELSKSADVAAYYKDLFRTAGFRTLIRQYIFGEMARQRPYEFQVFETSEVGYKLSKRKEKARPNHLCLFRGVKSKKEHPNLHLADEECSVDVNIGSPETALDVIRYAVKWS